MLDSNSFKEIRKFKVVYLNSLIENVEDNCTELMYASEKRSTATVSISEHWNRATTTAEMYVMVFKLPPFWFSFLNN